MNYSPKVIAAAVNGHLRALRYLGRTETTVHSVAACLGLTDAQVIKAFADYKMTKAKLNERKSRSYIDAHIQYSPLVDLASKRT